MAINIVLLSDGTGNSSSSPFKSNVWRLYQAIDIEVPPEDAKLPRQIVYYDNGVGTENFKPLRALGGAFGVGVWKNVKDIYTYVCRNYVPGDAGKFDDPGKPDDTGDQIYGFGFSRGAFTIRLVMGLIGKCGIVKALSDAQLDECVEQAYQAYRRDFLIRASESRWMIYNHILRGPNYYPDETTIDLRQCGCRQIFPNIRFIGVWDTVDAYGMPVDELKTVIDEWIWPLSVADREPSKRVKAIRHALSLDDERPTFRPVLWTEIVKDKDNPKDESKWEYLTEDKIKQVWFAGVHANVGGGYPDDGLSIAALDWMMDEAEQKGLHYIDWIRKEVHARANPQGEQYDSRGGVAGYYRYGPRKVAELCNDEKYGVAIPAVRLHPAAYNRIVDRERNYAPVSLRGPYPKGTKILVGTREVEQADTAGMEEAWDFVWWRRLAYFTTLGLTLFISLFALRLVFDWPNCILQTSEAGLRAIWAIVTGLLGPDITARIVSGWNWLLSNISGILPSWAGATVPSFRVYPLSGIVSLALLGWVFFFWTEKLRRRLTIHAEWAWHDHKKLDAKARPSPDWRNKVARVLRPITAELYRIWLVALVWILGIVIGVTGFVLFSPYLLWRWLRPRQCWMK